MFPLINVLCDYDPFYIPDGYKNGSFQGSVIKLFRLLYHNMIVYTICFLGDGKEIGVFKTVKEQLILSTGQFRFIAVRKNK